MIDPHTSSPARLAQPVVYRHLGPALKNLLEVEGYLKKSTLEPELRELIKLRASQINRCAYCIIYHRKDALKVGVSERRIHLLSVWQEAEDYSPRERAALAWTEAVTRISEHQLPESIYAEAQQVFSEKEIVDLSLAVGTINFWNRLSISFGFKPDAE